MQLQSQIPTFPLDPPILHLMKTELKQGTCAGQSGACFDRGFTIGVFSGEAHTPGHGPERP
jgi:hypothetical protein